MKELWLHWLGGVILLKGKVSSYYDYSVLVDRSVDLNGKYLTKRTKLAKAVSSMMKSFFRSCPFSLNIEGAIGFIKMREA